MLEVILAFVSVAAGIVAAVVGFGIGSFLTPLLALSLPMNVAVAAVVVPHLVATSVRCWLLRGAIDWTTFRQFGSSSAIGGALGAVLGYLVGAPGLQAVLGCLLVFVGLLGVSGQSARFVIPERWTQPAGLVSGMFGGLVGNQGGVRSAAMLGLNVQKEAFVATGTAVALLIDLARTPIYLWAHGQSLLGIQTSLAIMTVGVVAGTFLGRMALSRIPESQFRQVVSWTILLLGGVTFAQLSPLFPKI